MNRERVISIGRFVAIAVAIGAALYFLPVKEWSVAILEWTAGRGVWTGVVLAAVWIPAAIFLFPGAILTLGTGFLLGVAWGTLTVSIGSTLGALAAFLVGRTIARDRVVDMVEERPKFQAVDEAVGREGLKIVFLTRLSPIFPYNFLSYAYSVTGVSLRDFALGSWIGMLPGTLLYVYLGSGARTLAAIVSGGQERSTLELTLFGVGLVATVAVTIYVTRLAKSSLEEKVDDDE